MACDLSPQCNLLYGFFSCQLPEDTICIEITVRTLKGIHSFRKYCATQSSSCSPLNLQTKPFPLLLQKVDSYMEDIKRIANPFTPVWRPINLSSFAKKSTPRKRSKIESKRSSSKHLKSRKVNGRHFMPTKSTMATFILSPVIVVMTPMVPNTATSSVVPAKI